MSGWMDGQIFFSNRYSSYVFFPDFHETWHAFSMCHCAQNCGTGFQSFAFKILDLVAGIAAVEPHFSYCDGLL